MTRLAGSLPWILVRVPCLRTLEVSGGCFSVVLGTLVVTRQFVGDSIICWSPNEFNSQWQQYVDAYCWVMNTEYLPLDSHHSILLDGYAPQPIKYYQWTPLILFGQGQQLLQTRLLLLGNHKNGTHKNISLFKIVIFANTTLKVFHFLCQSSSHYVIKYSTKNDPNLQEKSRRLHQSFRSHF